MVESVDVPIVELVYITPMGPTENPLRFGGCSHHNQGCRGGCVGYARLPAGLARMQKRKCLQGFVSVCAVFPTVAFQQCDRSVAVFADVLNQILLRCVCFIGCVSFWWVV